MKLLLNWSKRVITLTLVISVVLIIGIGISFSVWKSQRINTLESQSQLYSTALGDIEAAIVGEGTPQLVLHGTPGGFDQGLLGWNAQPAYYPGLHPKIAVGLPQREK